MAVIAVDRAKVGDQELVEGAPVGGSAFEPLTLEPGGVPVTAHFDLQSADESDVECRAR